MRELGSIRWNQLIGLSRSIYRRQKAASSSASIEFGRHFDRASLPESGKKRPARLSNLPFEGLLEPKE
jgi:hypothetical protein